MKSIHGILKKICSSTDLLAGICFFSVMVLIVVNIIMRKVFVLPIPGAYDLVNLLIATGIGLALSNCALNDGHIAMSLVTDKLSKGKQQIIDIIVYLASLSFWAIVVWQMCVYGISVFNRGVVSPTATIPIYPFVFVLGFNVLCLSLVLAFKLADSVKGAVEMFRNRSGGSESEGEVGE